MKRKIEKAREYRIIMEIVVDAYGPEERSMGWYCYLENTMTFPFKATCNSDDSFTHLSKGDEVEVIGMAASGRCHEQMFVMAQKGGKKKFATPLVEIEPSPHVDEKTQEAIEDWQYWVKMGYGF